MRVILNGKPLEVAQGTTVAAAILSAGVPAFRRSVTGQPRGPLCGMGICFECRAIVDGSPHALTCQILCLPDMDIRTDD